MAESVKLINSIDGGTLTRDVDFSLFSKAVSNAGVVEGLSPTQVGGAGTDITIPAGEALIKVTRTSVTPNEIFYVVYRNTSDVVLTSGNNKKIFIEIEQTNINTPSNNTSPTGENIGSVKIADNYPSDNFLKLGETDGSGLLNVDVLEFYTIKQQVATKSNYGESNTGNDSYEISIPGINSYFDGLKLEVKADVANTGACTLNVNGLGIKAVKKQQGTVDLIDGDWGINGIATLVYNSTIDVWQFEGKEAVSSTGLVESTKSEGTLGESVSVGDPLALNPTDLKLYLLDASDFNKINFVGYADGSGVLNDVIVYSQAGVNNNQSGLIVGCDYYATDTAGIIGTSPGVITIKVGSAISTTSLLIKNIKQLNITASDDLLGNSSGLQQTSSSTYVKLKEGRIRIDGLYRIKFDLKTFFGLSFGRIYKNGIPFGTERSTNSGTATTYSEDLFFKSGDVVSVYCKDTSGGTAEISNFVIAGKLDKEPNIIL